MSGPDRDRKPGATTLASSNLATLEPGKSTLVQQQGIGNRYIEGKERCATAGADGCTLDAQVRERLVGAYQRKVRMAAAFYVQALGEIGLERLIQKDEELPAVVTMAIDLLGGYIGGAAAKSLLRIRNSAPSDFLKSVDGMLGLQDTGGDGAAPNAIKTLLNMTSPQAVEALMKGATDFGKKGVKKVAVSALASTEKADTLNYIDELKIAAAISFEHLDLDVPGNADDGQMIAAFHAFDAENGIDVPSFKAALKEKIARYRATVAKIGRADLPLDNAAHPGAAEPQQGDRARIRDTHIVWVAIVGDPVPRLYYAKVDYEWHPGSAQPALDDRFVLTRPVDLEFVGSAVLRHQEKWGAPPQIRAMTRVELARETGDESVLMTPRLDLSSRSAPTPPPAAQPSTKPSVADASVDVPPLTGAIL